MNKGLKMNTKLLSILKLGLFLIVSFLSFEFAFAKSSSHKLTIEVFSPYWKTKLPEKSLLLEVTRKECKLNQKKMADKICGQLRDLLNAQDSQSLKKQLGKKRDIYVADSPIYYLSYEGVRGNIYPRQARQQLVNPDGTLTPFETGASILDQVAFILVYGNHE